MMATLRCDHPDIVAFANAKRRAGRLRHFNLSVLVSDAFMQAVERDEDWPLVFPKAGSPAMARRSCAYGPERHPQGHVGSSDDWPRAACGIHCYAQATTSASQGCCSSTGSTG
jgi:ribonucleotide reductase alpha subunit